MGETFTSDRGLLMEYVGETELDGQFDFPLYYAVRDAFVWDAPFGALEGAVAAGGCVGVDCARPAAGSARNAAVTVAAVRYVVQRFIAPASSRVLSSSRLPGASEVPRQTRLQSTGNQRLASG